LHGCSIACGKCRPASPPMWKWTNFSSC
jgi:hypothetical protein